MKVCALTLKQALLSIGLLVAFVTTAFSQDLEISDDVRLGSASFISEMVECATFYSIIANAQDNKGNELDSKDDFFQLSENLLMFAFGLAEEIGMKSETVLSNAIENGKQMGEAIGFDAINISILTNKYGDLCKMVAEKPQDRFSYWLLKQVE